MTVAPHHVVSLAVGQDGDLLVLEHMAMADSGARLSRWKAQDGSSRWHRDLPGLGIAHSKYWHRVTAIEIGDAVRVVSDAAGGQWAVELDAGSGAVRRRVDRTAR